MDRINDKYTIHQEDIHKLFKQVMGLDVDSITFMTDGSSTINYRVDTLAGTYLIKFYPSQRDNWPEIHLMTSLQGQIRVPKIHHYDLSRKRVGTDYLISEFIEGRTYRLYVADHGISSKHAKEIGETLKVIHSKTYDAPHLFDQEKTGVRSILDQYAYYIDSQAIEHLGPPYRRYLKEILRRDKDLISSLNERTVRTHGDMNPGNILVDEDERLWFIDFEYGHATSPYLDFGKFLRKRQAYSCHLSTDILQVIRSAYQCPMPDNWIYLSMLADIPAILRLVDKDQANKWWVENIRRRLEDLYEGVDRESYTLRSWIET